MNIFILSNDPGEAAQLQCDKHVVKMIVESAQMLSTCHRILDGMLTKRISNTGKSLSKYWVLPDEREEILYKAVHMNHPCTVWTKQSSSNYEWHYKHFVSLCDEYTFRYGKIHKTDQRLREALRTQPNNMTISLLTPFALAMGASPESIDINDPIGSYRKFYKTKEKRFAMVWTNRYKPEWMK